jgi:serine/threonine protein phosphatase PrpC
MTAEPLGGALGVSCPVCSLDASASPAAISADGCCESCGRQVPSGRDHVELDLGWLAGVTDRGLRHPRNEDAMAFATAETAAGPVAVAVVCDGVSTSPRSDEASLAGTQAAVRMLLTSMRRGDDATEASLAAVRQAHLALTSLGSSAQAPSATYISATISGEAVTVCWLGDSRAYWLATDSEAGFTADVDQHSEEHA